MQTTEGSVKNILKLKENFPNLLMKKLEDIYKTINNKGKPKPHIHTTTKDLSQKQIIISMSKNNIEKFITLSGKHVANMNHTLRSIKLDTLIDFICRDHQDLVVIANKVALPSNWSIVKNYIKNVQLVDVNNI